MCLCAVIGRAVGSYLHYIQMKTSLLVDKSQPILKRKGLFIFIGGKKVHAGEKLKKKCADLEASCMNSIKV